MQVILFDLDGVIYLGDTAVPGAQEALRWVHAGDPRRICRFQGVARGPGRGRGRGGPWQAGGALLRGRPRHARDIPSGDPDEIGDDIRGDVHGARAAGLKGALVRTGKFRPEDLRLGPLPDGVLSSIADLPDWWEATTSAGLRPPADRR